MKHLLSRAQLFKDQIVNQIRQAAKTEDKRPPSIETTKLEERILLSASPIAELAADAASTQQQNSQAQDDGNSTQQSSAKQVVFIDPQVDAADKLQYFLTHEQNNPDVQVFLLDADEDGIVQITEKLAAFSNLDSIHLISNVSGDAIYLGNAQLSNDTLLGYAADLSEWGFSLNAQADLLIYGSDLANGEQGRLLIDSLASLTGADLAASDDLTGHASLGGDWDLEYTTGSVETQVVLAQETQSNWNGQLYAAASNAAQQNQNTATETNSDGVQVTNLKWFLETLSDGAVVNLAGQVWYYAEPITVTANNVTIDFGGTEINRTVENKFIIQFKGSNNTISNLVLDGQFDFTASDIMPTSIRNEGLRIVGHNNVFINVDVKNLPVGPNADAFDIRGNNTQLINCSSTDAGGASINVEGANNVFIDNFTSTFTAATANTDIDWTTGTRPRHLTGTGNSTGAVLDSVTIQNSSFTSDGIWAYFVMDSPFGLENFNFTNNTVDHNDAEFQPGTSINQRYIFKLDNIGNLLFEDNTFTHGKNHVMDIFFVGCGSFTGNGNVGDGYYALFTPAYSGGSLIEMHITQTQWGVNAQIPWAIGRSGTTYETDVRFASISDSAAFNIADDVVGRPNPNRAAIWGTTDGDPASTIWTITNCNFEFIGEPGIVIDANENTVAILNNATTSRLQIVFDEIKTIKEFGRSNTVEAGGSSETALNNDGQTMGQGTNMNLNDNPSADSTVVISTEFNANVGDIAASEFLASENSPLIISTPPAMSFTETTSPSVTFNLVDVEASPTMDSDSANTNAFSLLVDEKADLASVTQETSHQGLESPGAEDAPAPATELSQNESDEASAVTTDGPVLIDHFHNGTSSSNEDDSDDYFSTVEYLDQLS